ncbi:haloacid dehalogenase type II [Dichotomicrobium thermohalophilum]|uniref:(S)-2-haloacid dehalogenase n=1 Tax=Dichotomicrobium thermohalophilum TaxID=933063 RepID=A0A397QBF3_9HYPH|nr:haloacid dehalogenase type II [Dichotomicrobium thermohalophilum]RIA55541.1 2-haloacid dehalogenase [Dichotomicrobium thermohalophilum]
MSDPAPSLSGLRAVAFDAYGTLFDVHAPMARLAGEIGPNAALVSELWRQKQLQYTWLRSLMRDYANFWQVTCDALDYALEAHGIATPELRDKLLALYRDLDTYDDAASALSALRERGIATAILSNGAPDMLQQAVAHAGFPDLLDHVISVDTVGIYKPDPRTYQLAVDAFDLPREQIGFVSANGWDVAGAAHFGLAVCHLNRFSQPPEHLPAKPLAVINSLSDFQDLLAPAA